MANPPTASDDPLLRIPEVAKRLNVSREYVYKLIRQKDLGHVQLPMAPGAKWSGKRVSESQLAAFLQRNEQPATAPAAT